MKATVLSVYDEGALERTSLIGARGISMLIDVDGERTLFDTGMRGNYLLHNMDELEVDVNTVDRIVISHAHRAHTGGLAAFLDRRNEAIDVLAPSRIDMRRTLFGMPLGKTEIPAEASAKMRSTTVNEWTQLSDNLFVTGKVAAGAAQPPQEEENSLVLMTKKGPVLICGCCHHGPENVMSYVRERTNRKVAAIIGGIHLVRMKRNDVHEVADMLKGNGPPALYLNHCTGYSQRTYLREELGMDAVKEFYVGTDIQFDV